MYYVGLRQENWETKCGYVYEMTIRLKDHADQLWCAYTPVYDAGPTLFTSVHCLVSRLDEQHNIDYRCSADPMRFNVGPASATSDNIESASGQRIVVAL